MKSLRFFVLSDVHLELRHRKCVPSLVSRLPSARGKHLDLLILAGDIGNPFAPLYAEFVEACAKTLPVSSYVLVTLGNHERYNGQPEEKVIQQARQCLSRLSPSESCRIHLLERDSWTHPHLPGLHVHGCTLWSDAHPDPKISGVLNDFEQIRELKIRHSKAEAIQLYREWHQRDRQWLEATLPVTPREGETHLVITHHLPSFRLVCDSRFGGIEELTNHLFASQCDHLVERADFWCCGHSHEARVLPKMILNPVGYPGELQLHPCDWDTIHTLPLTRDQLTPDPELEGLIDRL